MVSQGKVGPQWGNGVLHRNIQLNTLTETALLFVYKINDRIGSTHNRMKLMYDGTVFTNVSIGFTDEVISK